MNVSNCSVAPQTPITALLGLGQFGLNVTATGIPGGCQGFSKLSRVDLQSGWRDDGALGRLLATIPRA